MVTGELSVGPQKDLQQTKFYKYEDAIQLTFGGGKRVRTIHLLSLFTFWYKARTIQMGEK